LKIFKIINQEVLQWEGVAPLHPTFPASGKCFVHHHDGGAVPREHAFGICCESFCFLKNNQPGDAASFKKQLRGSQSSAAPVPPIPPIWNVSLMEG